MAKTKRKTRKRYTKKQQKQYHAKARLALLCLGIGFCFFLLFSCASFHIADWPSNFYVPHNHPAANWCGSVGAFFAYFLLYYLGPGVFLILISTAVLMIRQITNHGINQLGFRGIGLALTALAISSSYYCLWPDKVFAFPFGSGGILGVSFVTLLRSNFAALGTFILIAATWVVGLILLADDLVLAIPLWLGIAVTRLASTLSPAWSAAREQSEALADIWQRLSAKQKQRVRPRSIAEPALATAGGPLLPSIVQKEDLEDVDHTPEEVEQEEVETDTEEKQPPVEETQEDRLERMKALAVKRMGGQQQKQAYVQPSYDDYTLPPLDLLEEAERGYLATQEKLVKAKAAALEQLLRDFNITAHVVAAETGPTVTMFELDLAAGIKVSRITTLANDIARALSAGVVRVVAPLQGKHTIGIEVPNSEKEKVRMRNMFELAGEKPAKKMHIPLYFGKDSSGEALVSDLAKMPHLLIAGTTGSGKSVCINSIIMSVLLTKRPDEVKLVMVDPKMVEMAAFNSVPHLMCPIVTETQVAVNILEWATVKMDERYAVLAEARVKNVAEFNKLGTEEVIRRFDPTTPEEEAKIPKKLPYIVIIIDELADLMMTAAKEIEAYIVRLAQKSRAVGIHLVLATQRPQATVVTGLIKSNMPCRVGFRVAARMDSRIILDQNGAETLLGEGDMLFLKPGTSDLIRAQGTFLDEMEIRRVVKHLKTIAEPQFHPELTQLKNFDSSAIEKDELFDEAVRVVLASKRGSVSLLQRRLSIGYARSSRIIEMMASAGILGEYKGSQAREVLMNLEEYEAVCQQMEADAAAGFSDLAEDPAPDTEAPENTSEEVEEDSDDEEEYEYIEVDEDEEEEDVEYEYVDVEEDEEDEDDEEEEDVEYEEETDIADLNVKDVPVSYASEGQREYMAMDVDED
ncbi:DNA translocase FtsK [Planctomycetota bacterium]